MFQLLCYSHLLVDPFGVLWRAAEGAYPYLSGRRQCTFSVLLELSLTPPTSQARTAARRVGDLVL